MAIILIGEIKSQELKMVKINKISFEKLKVLVINAALGINVAPWNADVNRDSDINALDVQLVINAALGL